MNKTITVFLIFINLFVAGSFTNSVVGQTRRGTVNRRAPRRATRSRPPVRRPPVVAAPPSSAAVTTASGLTYIVTRRGAGRPLKSGDRVTVNYTGLLTNGAKFDSSLDRGAPFTFQIGAGRVIKGWDEGVGRLRVGDHATFILPPQLGYGARGAGSDIPPDSTLVFIIEVLSVEEPLSTPSVPTDN
ncbi:MAG: FKBP-type peptidyl-prolyl cis-trans isomerase [Pyrinomonadaceae bacterium MAG19_C2-C3]|nr:FKBP-type peptidyl-prolyl cis-trans isomerase [Pyrinomonadaceae bacterium MAG19_C2-C3]